MLVNRFSVVTSVTMLNINSEKVRIMSVNRFSVVMSVTMLNVESNCRIRRASRGEERETGRNGTGMKVKKQKK